MSTHHEQHLVSGRWTADGVRESTGISWDDMKFMQTHSKTGWSKMTPTPAFVLNNKKFREVVVRLVERRAGLTALRTVKGTHRERIERAHGKLLETRPLLIARIEKLYRRYVEAKSKGEPTEKLISLIEGLDSQICTLDKMPALIGAVLYLSYRIGLDSPGVTASLSQMIKPPAVRQILCRAKVIAERLDGRRPWFRPTPGPRRKAQ